MTPPNFFCFDHAKCRLSDPILAFGRERNIDQLGTPLIGLSFQRFNMQRMELIPSINSMATCRVQKQRTPSAF